MAKKQPVLDQIINGKRVRVYTCRAGYEALVGDGDISDPEAEVWEFPRVGTAEMWAVQAELNSR